MTGSELVEAMRSHAPVILDNPGGELCVYYRIVRVEYSLTSDHRSPSNTHDGITVAAVLADPGGRSYTTAEPRYVHKYSRADFDRRKKERSQYE